MNALNPKQFLVLALITLAVTVLPILRAQEATEQPQPESTEEIEIETLQDETPDIEPAAQDTATPVPPLEVTGSEPPQIVRGQSGTLTILGQNFTSQTTVRLVGFGLLDVTFINSGALRATLPNNIPAGQYNVQVSDPVHGSATSPNTLSVVNPTVTPRPTDIPQPTSGPPTAAPGEPSLILRAYSAQPAVTVPGGTVTFTVEVYNQGTRAAQGVSVQIDAGSSFMPARNQANVILPDLLPFNSVTFTLNAVADSQTPSGTATIPLTFFYRDFENRTYTSTGAMFVDVQGVFAASQITLSSYRVNPDPARPGDPVAIQVEVTNSGNKLAAQVLLQVTAGSGVLLAGARGDSFPLGDIPPGGAARLNLPLIVSMEAQPGPQLQPVTISYTQEGEPRQVSTSMTVNVAETEQAEPLFLLESYHTGKDLIQPGERFTMTARLRNIGDADAQEVFVDFGTNPVNDEDDATPASNEMFAPVGTGGTLYLGTIPADSESVEFEQDFVVNGTLLSGIYNLPLNLRYQLPDGEESATTLNARLVIAKPPRLTVLVQQPLPEQVEVGEPIFFSADVMNTGPSDVTLTFIEVSAENGDVIEGESTFVGLLFSGDVATIEASLISFDEGAVTITLTMNYIDDFNQERQITETFVTEATLPPPPPTAPPQTEPDLLLPPTPPPEPDMSDFFGRLLRGLLGLGS